MSEGMTTIQDPQAEIDDESDYEDFDVGRNYALFGRLYFTCHSSRDMTRKMICENPVHFYFSNVGPEVRAPHAHTNTHTHTHTILAVRTNGLGCVLASLCRAPFLWGPWCMCCS